MLGSLLSQGLLAGFFVLGVLAFQRRHWALGAFIALTVVYYPIRGDFYLAYRPCEVAFDLPLAIYSLRNYTSIVLFFGFYLMVAMQLPMKRPRDYAVALAITLAMGGLVEASEGVWGRGNCRLRDLLPVAAGAVIAAATMAIRVRRGYDATS